jgi:hypothetical protein
MMIETAMSLEVIGVPGQPAMQPHSGRVGLVVTRRVPGSAAVEFCEWSAPLVQPLYTIGNREQPLCIADRPRHASNAASRLDCI